MPFIIGVGQCHDTVPPEPARCPHCRCQTSMFFCKLRPISKADCPSPDRSLDGVASLPKGCTAPPNISPLISVPCGLPSPLADCRCSVSALCRSTYALMLTSAACMFVNVRSTGSLSAFTPFPFAVFLPLPNLPLPVPVGTSGAPGLCLLPLLSPLVKFSVVSSPLPGGWFRVFFLPWGEAAACSSLALVYWLLPSFFAGFLPGPFLYVVFSAAGGDGGWDEGGGGEALAFSVGSGFVSSACSGSERRSASVRSVLAPNSSSPSPPRLLLARSCLLPAASDRVLSFSCSRFSSNSLLAFPLPVV